MNRRILLESAILAIPGVGWLLRRSGAGIQPRLSDVKGRLIWSEWPRTVKFARVKGRAFLDHNTTWVISMGGPLLSVQIPTGLPIPLIAEERGRYRWFDLMWHKGEWWVIWTSYISHKEALKSLKRYPKQNKPFIDAFTNPNYVLIDPFSKTAHHQT